METATLNMHDRTFIFRLRLRKMRFSVKKWLGTFLFKLGKRIMQRGLMLHSEQFMTNPGRHYYFSAEERYKWH